MDDNDNDVVMDGEEHSINSHSAQNGFHYSGDFDMGLESASPDGQSDLDESEEEEDPTAYPQDLRRKGLLPTGCCYDVRMKLHANADFGPNPHHPEDPSRIDAIMNAFKRNGLVYSGPPEKEIDVINTNPTQYMWRIPAREATQDEICIVHRPEHYEWVKDLDNKTTQDLRRLTKILDSGRDSLYVGSMTFPAALISAGGAIETCKSVVNGNVKNAFAVIRPPGHHAEFDSPMGFCLFNNVPIAAKICQQQFPDLCRKILILDWDVHHGNGTQNMFYNDPNILYISIHVYINGTFYPGKPDNPMTPDGGIENCGTGAGLGRNVNIGWHDQGMGDGEYMAAFQKIIMPIAQEFNPDLTIISAGFDAADGDELGGCFVTPACYAHMTHMLMSLSNGKLAVCLEGGYNLRAISQSAVAVARTLMGEPPPMMTIPKINKEAARLLAKVQAHQAPYWECMRPGIVDVQDIQSLGGVRLHDVVRTYQRQMLSQNFGMIPLYIQRETLFKSYENQVLITRGVHESRRLLMIIHDPPALLAQPDSLDNSIEAHNGWVADGVTQYIEWAVAQKFGVMDINIPYYVTHPEDTDPFTQRTDERAMQLQIQELVCYIWDNYLQLWDNVEEIFLMGVGFAYLGVKTLLISRDCKSRISGVVNFVNGTLRPVKSDVDQELSSWYKENSRVFVADDHACWSDSDLTRKVSKKRFGAVVHSPHHGLNRMMRAHAGEVYNWILDRVVDGHGDTTEEDKVN